MRPIWEYAKKLRINNKQRHHPIRKQDGKLTQNLNEELQRRQEVLQGNFYQGPTKNLPAITHITETQWGKTNNQK